VEDNSANAGELRRAAIPGLPDETYIMEDRAVERVLFGRELVGAEFARVCLEASLGFCRLLTPRLDVPDIAELLILNGGRYYGLATAYERVFGRSLPVDELKATRRQDPDGAWVADISYRRYAHKPRTLLIGDTVATGVSARVALVDYFAYHTPAELIFFTICGAIIGAPHHRGLRGAWRAPDARVRRGRLWPRRQRHGPALPAPRHAHGAALFGARAGGLRRPACLRHRRLGRARRGPRRLPRQLGAR